MLSVKHNSFKGSISVWKGSISWSRIDIIKVMAYCFYTPLPLYVSLDVAVIYLSKLEENMHNILAMCYNT